MKEQRPNPRVFRPLVHVSGPMSLQALDTKAMAHGHMFKGPSRRFDFKTLTVWDQKGYLAWTVALGVLW